MAPPRFRFLLFSCLVALTLRLSHCQGRRQCDCNAEGNITYVCLLRCGRGSSGGGVIVMPVKKSPVPSPFHKMQEKFALHQDRSEQDIVSLKRDTVKPRPFSLASLQSTARRLRELLSLTNAIEPRGSQYT
ncbi:uncharacterized protein LOC119726232 [Patiria miniata]|uniref:Uncharacterized protein n=1 Tax=Patiria miniata TaxID=46514 RepID=A0A913ZPZ0_PATMI|nr:uncharacterized protein LOC119726232 [Patiria miniata]